MRKILYAVLGLLMVAAPALSVLPAAEAHDGNHRHMILYSIFRTEPPEQQQVQTLVEYCETNQVASGWKTTVDVLDGRQFDIYNLRVQEDTGTNGFTPVWATDWVRTGESEFATDRRITWCRVREDGKVQVQSRDGGNWLITELRVDA